MIEGEVRPVGGVENLDDPLTVRRFSPGCPKPQGPVFPPCESWGRRGKAPSGIKEFLVNGPFTMGADPAIPGHPRPVRTMAPLGTDLGVNEALTLSSIPAFPVGRGSGVPRGASIDIGIPVSGGVTGIQAPREGEV